MVRALGGEGGERREGKGGEGRGEEGRKEREKGNASRKKMTVKTNR